jgi:hypothetical protein
MMDGSTLLTIAMVVMMVVMMGGMIARALGAYSAQKKAQPLNSARPAVGVLPPRLSTSSGRQKSPCFYAAIGKSLFQRGPRPR